MSQSYRKGIDKIAPRFIRLDFLKIGSPSGATCPPQPPQPYEATVAGNLASSKAPATGQAPVPSGRHSHLCVLSLAPLERDARVLRQIQLGQDLGYRVTAIAWGRLDRQRAGVALKPVAPWRFGRAARAAQALLVAAGRVDASAWRRWYWRKPDHAAAHDHDVVAFAAHALPAISCSMSCTDFGASAVSTLHALFVTTTSSSMRMPMPRHFFATSRLSGAM